MFTLEFDPHPSDPSLRMMFIDPHPLTGKRRHVGICGLTRSRGWGLLNDKALKLNAWEKEIVNQLMEDHFDRLERKRPSADAR